ncbi:hypothetical protein HNQ36_005323 [Afipia massiliensis]|uniref:Uncharacterized protein n=1 Tax=Afipia massiliensis TaxID=211460 RepID=A0A840N919_9BRAD|nr:hypothetical protein [Afipia massiliensis]MBB5055312.1 hypothetical protein [Afipia massiliensis]
MKSIGLSDHISQRFYREGTISFPFRMYVPTLTFFPITKMLMNAHQVAGGGF